MDTIARLKEIEQISLEVSRHNVSHRNIIDPAREFADTFSTDISAKAIIGQNANYFQEYFFAIDEGKAKKAWRDFKYSQVDAEFYFKFLSQ